MATTDTYPARTMIRWGAIVAGAVIGVALMVLLVSLFVALGGQATAIAANVHWFGLVSAAIALFAAGFLAAWLSGVRGVMPGLLHGLTAWGLIFLLAIAFPFPQAFGVMETFATPLPELGASALWAAFLSLLVGAVLAAVGGLLGGITTPVTERPGARRYDEDRAGYEEDRARYEERPPAREYEEERARRGERPTTVREYEYEEDRMRPGERPPARGGYETEPPRREPPARGYEEPPRREQPAPTDEQMRGRGRYR
jgi:hypothetical protein